MEPRSRRLANVYAGVAAATSVITPPLPGGDELMVASVHYWFALHMATRRGVSVFKLPWRSIQRIIWYGAAARLCVEVSVALIPVVGALTNATTAVALTEFLARWLDDFLKNPDDPPPEVSLEGLKALFADAVRKREAEERRQQGRGDGAR
jgi:uncharacterized protein (DUF697 family)